MLITLAARFVSVYGPGVTPPEFPAVVEVVLAGAWHLVEATGMATGADMAVIGVGRDAADTSFLTHYAGCTLNRQEVRVSRILAL
ncbi:MAG: transglutaminase family protein, partial [Novosphingobium sp.]